MFSMTFHVEIIIVRHLICGLKIIVSSVVSLS